MLDFARPTPTNVIHNAHSEGAFPFWEKGIHGEGVTVAVLDTGVNEVGVVGGQLARRVDLTGEEYLGDLSGHGTQMSQFILGYAPKAKIVSVRVVDKAGTVDRDTLIRGLDFCASHYPEIRVVNISLGILRRFGPWAWCTEEKPCRLCAKANEVASTGLIVIAAAGNRKMLRLPRLSSDTVNCPGNAKEVFTVGATGKAITKRSGRLLRILSPSVYYKGGSGHSGTSVSAAHSSGGIALLLSDIDNLTLREIKNALIATATPLLGEPKGTGGGRIHFYRGYKLLTHRRAGKSFDPVIADRHYLKGVILRQAGDERASLDEFRKAVEFSPTNVVFHNELGVAYLHGHMVWRALEHFREAVRINWWSAIPHGNLGIALERLGRKAEALKHYEMALELDPELAQPAFDIWHLMQDT